jgi:hypothetical protein
MRLTCQSGLSPLQRAVSIWLLIAHSRIDVASWEYLSATSWHREGSEMRQASTINSIMGCPRVATAACPMQVAITSNGSSLAYFFVFGSRSTFRVDFDLTSQKSNYQKLCLIRRTHKIKQQAECARRTCNCDAMAQIQQHTPASRYIVPWHTPAPLSVPNDHLMGT